MLLPVFLKKDWGWEYWFANINETDVDVKRTQYCGKILYVEHNKWSSNFKYHYHKIKDETLVVLEGILQLDYVTDIDTLRTIYLNPLNTFRIKPGMKHRFSSVSETGCKFAEASTFDSGEDSFRCVWNTKTGEWVDD